MVGGVGDSSEGGAVSAGWGGCVGGGVGGGRLTRGEVGGSDGRQRAVDGGGGGGEGDSEETGLWERSGGGTGDKERERERMLDTGKRDGEDKGCRNTTRRNDGGSGGRGGRYQDSETEDDNPRAAEMNNGEEEVDGKARREVDGMKEGDCVEDNVVRQPKREAVEMRGGGGGEDRFRDTDESGAGSADDSDLDDEHEEELVREVVGERSRDGPESSWPLTHMKILLVEDDDCTRHVVCALLKNCNYEVVPVSNGLEALDVLGDTSRSIDLVLSDVVMPGFSGLQLLAKIMQYESLKRLPVVMMSSYDSVDIVFKCLQKGAADFLVKPVRKNELKNLWQHVWRRSKSSSGSGSGSGSGTGKVVTGRRVGPRGQRMDTGSNGDGNGSGCDSRNGNINGRNGSDNVSGTQNEAPNCGGGGGAAPHLQQGPRDREGGGSGGELGGSDEEDGQEYYMQTRGDRDEGVATSPRGRDCVIHTELGIGMAVNGDVDFGNTAHNLKDGNGEEDDEADDDADDDADGDDDEEEEEEEEEEEDEYDIEHERRRHRMVTEVCQEGQDRQGNGKACGRVMEKREGTVICCSPPEESNRNVNNPTAGKAIDLIGSIAAIGKKEVEGDDRRAERGRMTEMEVGMCGLGTASPGRSMNDGFPGLELSLKRSHAMCSGEDEKASSAEDRKILKQSDSSAFSRYVIPRESNFLTAAHQHQQHPHHHHHHHNNSHNHHVHYQSQPHQQQQQQQQSSKAGDGMGGGSAAARGPFAIASSGYVHSNSAMSPLRAGGVSTAASGPLRVTPIERSASSKGSTEHSSQMVLHQLPSTHLNGITSHQDLSCRVRQDEDGFAAQQAGGVDEGIATLAACGPPHPPALTHMAMSHHLNLMNPYPVAAYEPLASAYVTSIHPLPHSFLGAPPWTSAQPLSDREQYDTASQFSPPTPGQQHQSHHRLHSNFPRHRHLHHGATTSLQSSAKASPDLQAPPGPLQSSVARPSSPSCLASEAQGSTPQQIIPSQRCTASTLPEGIVGSRESGNGSVDGSGSLNGSATASNKLRNGNGPMHVAGLTTGLVVSVNGVSGAIDSIDQSSNACQSGTAGSNGAINGTAGAVFVGHQPNHSARREAALSKFRQKRKERCFEKKVRYQSRKRLAEQRPRVRGQFVRQAAFSS